MKIEHLQYFLFFCLIKAFHSAADSIIICKKGVLYDAAVT
jgi:hypothetical protein